MKVYLVNAGHNYYPGDDNTKFVTTDLDRAYASVKRLEKSGKYDWVSVHIKGVDK